MKNKDDKIKTEINEILQHSSVGIKLKEYFENIPLEKTRRAIHILSIIYPNKKDISDDDFLFIPYMLSNEKYLKQQSFSNFIRSINIIDFTDDQKNILIDVIKNHFEELCKVCTFELDALLMRVFSKSGALKYIKTLSKNSSEHVLCRVDSILRYENH